MFRVIAPRLFPVKGMIYCRFSPLCFVLILTPLLPLHRFTGSEVGVLREFLRLEDPEAPLYGRHRREIFLGGFTAQQALGFLKAGQGCNDQ